MIEELGALVGGALPATVVVAITLFIVREVLEARRRRRSEARRLEAIRRLLAREVELNKWTERKLLDALSAVTEFSHDDSTTLEVRRLSTGGDRFYRRPTDAPDGASFPLPAVYDAELRKHLLEIATLDKNFLEIAEAAVDAVAEMRHVRDSLVSYLSGDEETFPEFLDGFASYGKEELKAGSGALTELYLACTGKDEIPIRLR